MLTQSKNDVPADDRPKATRNLPRVPRHEWRRHHRRLPDPLRPARDYLERALHDYQKGGRKNAIMAGMAATLTAEDIEQLAAYYSRQKPALADRSEEELLLLVRS